jgi:glyoxylase-like metal-dependent hydrolase (beta-lactamase superfamily II)
MDRFRIGAIEVSRVEEQRIHFDASMFFPDLTRETAARHAEWLAPFFDIDGHRMPCVFQSWVLRHDGATILIDTCIGNDKERPDFADAHRLRTPYLERLAAAGVTPADVDVVCCTHMHVDHVGWNTRLDNGRWVPTFPNATYLFSGEEYARYAPEHRRPDAPPPFLDIFDDSVLPVIESGQALMVSGTHEVNDVLTVDPAPGHTPGHIALRVSQGGSTAVFLGDIMHNPVQVAEPDLNSSFCELPDLARATRRGILDRAAEGNHLLVPGHFVEPHVGRVARQGSSFRFLPGA